VTNLPAPPRTFAEFWPYYVAAHRDPRCRALHYVGSTGALAALVAALATANPLWLPAGVVWGYGCAWAGHFVFERNRPATWVRWWWSLLGDWKMYGLWLTGRLGPHLAAAKDLPDPGAVFGR
jgi:hypothetical protein